MEFGKSVCYIDVWKSLTFGSDPVQNDRLTNDLLNVTIFLSLKMQKRIYLGTERDKAIKKKILTLRLSAEITDNFSQIVFPTTFGGLLKFLR